MAQAGDLSVRRLGAAPHRLLFFVGATNVLIAMAWWSAWLISANATSPWMPQPEGVPAGWLHAYVMQYQMLPSFMFGFLLTVFPRWMNLPELPWSSYLGVGIGLFGGQIATVLGAFGVGSMLTIGWLMTVLGWVTGLVALAPHLWREQGTTWHAWSCFVALAVGLVGLTLFGLYLLSDATWAWRASAKIGTFGLLLPVYLTVAHRMFPFFAGNVLPGYLPWRPLWLLTAFWVVCIAHLVLELAGAISWLWVIDAPMCVLAIYVCWRWGPRRSERPLTPPLLAVLFLGLGWLPVTFGLYAVQSIGYALSGTYQLGYAPAHALFIGFFGSILVAMVTRVTQGHSGRALTLPKVAVVAFVAIQLVAVIRIMAEMLLDPMFWYAVAGVGWLLGLGFWILWLGATYLAPRVDGKAG